MLCLIWEALLCSFLIHKDFFAGCSVKCIKNPEFWVPPKFGMTHIYEKLTFVLEVNYFFTMPFKTDSSIFTG